MTETLLERVKREAKKPKRRTLLDAVKEEARRQGGPLSFGEGAQQAGSSALRGLAGGVAGMLDLPVALGHEIASAILPEDAQPVREEALLARAGAALREGAAEVAPPVPGLEDSFLLSKLPAAVAGSAPLLAAGPLGGLAGVAVTGAASGAGGQLKAAQDKGASPAMRALAAAGGATLGALEAAGIGRAAARLGTGVVGGIAGEVAEETIINPVQAVGEELLAAGTYDPGRDVSAGRLADVGLEAAKLGAVAGGAVAGGVSAANVGLNALARRRTLLDVVKEQAGIAPAAETSPDPASAEESGISENEAGVAIPSVPSGPAVPVADDVPDLDVLPVTVQRTDEPGAAAPDVSNPHGVYAARGDLPNPHADLGGATTTWRVNPKANVLRLEEFPADEIAMRRGAISAGAGVHAVRQILGPEEFARLRGLSRADLQAWAEGEFPGTDYARYHDKQEVMEGVGGQLARRAGYDAIYTPDRESPKFSEFVLLTPNAASLDVPAVDLPAKSPTYTRLTKLVPEFGTALEDAKTGEPKTAMGKRLLELSEQFGLMKSARILRNALDLAETAKEFGQDPAATLREALGERDTLSERDILADSEEVIPEVREELARMATRVGWDQEGGRLRRDDEGTVLGRDIWIAKEPWWADRPHDARLSEAATKRAVDKYLAGKKLGVREQRAIEYMLAVAQETMSPGSLVYDEAPPAMAETPTPFAPRRGRQYSPKRLAQEVPAPGEADIGFGLTGQMGPPPVPYAGGPVGLRHVKHATQAIVGAVAKKLRPNAAVPVIAGGMGRAVQNAAGFYDPTSSAIQIAEAEDAMTVAHEVGHAVDALLTNNGERPVELALRESGVQAFDELRKLGKELYPEQPPNGWESEGFAQWLFYRVWSAERAAQVAPKFDAWMNGHLYSIAPEVLAAIERAGVMGTAYRNQGAKDRDLGNRHDPAAFAQRWEDKKALWKRVLSPQTWFESFFPLMDLDKILKREGSDLRVFGVAKSMRGLAPGVRERWVKHGVYDTNLQRIGPSLDEVFAPVRGEKLLEWAVYQQALHTRDQWAHGLNPGQSLEDANYLIEHYQGDPNIQEASRLYRAFQHAKRVYMAEHVPQKAEMLRQLEDVWSDYVPQHRYFEESREAWTEATKKGIHGRQLISHLQGSFRPKFPVVEQILIDAERSIAWAHEQRLAQVLRLAASVPNTGEMIHEVEPSIGKVGQIDFAAAINQISRAIEKTVGGLGGNINAIDRTEAQDLAGRFLEIYGAVDPKVSAPLLKFYDEGAGRFRFYAVRPDIYHMFEVLGPHKMHESIDGIVRGMRSTFVLGTTAYRPSFALMANIALDIPTFYMNSQAKVPFGLRAPVLLARYFHALGDGIREVASGGKFKSEWLDFFGRLGLKGGQSLSQYGTSTRAARRQLERVGIRRIVNLDTAWEVFRDIMQVTEQSPRLAEFKSRAKQLGWKPGMPMDLATETQLRLAAKEVTWDPTASGEATRFFNAIEPFFNVAFQGPRSFARAAVRDRGLFVLRMGGMILPSIAYWLMVRDDERWRSKSARDRYGSWHFPVTIGGKKEIVEIPRTNELAILVGWTEALLDGWYRSEPEQATAWANEMLRSSLPSPPITVPGRVLLEDWANKRFYTDLPIESDTMLHKAPEERIGPATTRAAVAAGQALGVSPLRIDHWMRGLFGGLGTDILDALGVGRTATEGEPADLPMVGRFFARQGGDMMYGKTFDAFYDLWEAADMRKERETPEQRVRRLALDDTRDAIALLRPIVADPRVPREKRRELAAKARQFAAEAFELSSAPKVQRGPFLRMQAEAEREALYFDRTVRANRALGAGL